MFNQIQTGNGTFQVSSNPNNTGGGLVGSSSVTDAADYDGGTYAINFTSATTYTVNNTATNAQVSSGHLYRRHGNHFRRRERDVDRGARRRR